MHTHTHMHAHARTHSHHTHTHARTHTHTHTHTTHTHTTHHTHTPTHTHSHLTTSLGRKRLWKLTGGDSGRILKPGAHCANFATILPPEKNLGDCTRFLSLQDKIASLSDMLTSDRLIDFVMNLSFQQSCVSVLKLD